MTSFLRKANRQLRQAALAALEVGRGRPPATQRRPPHHWCRVNLPGLALHRTPHLCVNLQAIVSKDGSRVDPAVLQSGAALPAWPGPHPLLLEARPACSLPVRMPAIMLPSSLATLFPAPPPNPCPLPPPRLQPWRRPPPW